jgi:hypothetical protein
MSWFNEKKKVYPTKMFVNYLPEVSKEEKTKTVQTKSVGSAMLSAALGTQSVALDMILTAAPKLIDQGMHLMAKTLESLAVDKAFPTTVRRNFDIINPAKLSLPSQISLVRGNFAANNTMQGEIFGDGTTRSRNQVVLLGNKELHIEIDIIQSQDKSAIYFQPSSYFYGGQSPEGHQISEIVLAFAFLPAGRSIVEPQKDFKNFLHFEALNPNQHYNFKSENGYDTSFQSAWITSPLKDVEPYTIVIQIQEIRAGNSFAKLLQTIYVENESNIESKLKQQVTSLKEKQNEK